MDYSLFKNGLHDLKNQLLELQLVWDLIAEENKIENNRFGKMLGKVKITAEFLQEITRCNDAVEPIDLGNIINTAILELKEKGLLFPCLITDSLPIVTVNRSLLLWMLQALFPIALRRFKRGILVKGEVNKEVVLLFFEAGSEPLPEKLYIPWDLGTSTVSCLISLLNGKVEWNDETSNNSIKITLPILCRDLRPPIEPFQPPTGDLRPFQDLRDLRDLRPAASEVCVTDSSDKIGGS